MLVSQLHTGQPIPFGSPLELACNDVDGFPAPRIRWTFESFNSTPVILTDSYIVRVDEFGESHEGIYVCTASNGVGKPARRAIRVYGEASGKYYCYNSYG